MRKRFLIVAVILCSMIYGKTLTAQEDSCNFEGDPIPIGAIIPLSEPGEIYYGERMLWSFEFARDHINENCGIEINGVQHPVEFIYEDTSGQPERGVIAAEKLVNEDKVVGLMGESHSAVALAAINAINSMDAPLNLTPFIVTFAWSDEITALKYPNVFRVAPTVTLAETKITQWMIEEGFEHVVIITENTSYGISATEADERALSEAGVLVDVIIMDFASEDFTPILEELDAIGTPDLIYVQTSASFPILAELIDGGYMPTAETACMIIQNLTPEFWAEHPGVLNCLTTDIRVPEQNYTELSHVFVDAYVEAFGSKPIGAAFAAFDSLYLLVDAIDRAESTDPEAIITALETADIDLAQGHYYFPYTSLTENPEEFPDYMWHQWPDPVAEVLQYQEIGQSPEDAVVIYPYEYSTGEYVIVGE